MLDWLLAVGLVLSAATQLRLEGLPVGVGEALLLLWSYLTGLEIIRQKRLRPPPHLRPFVFFFVTLLLLLITANLLQVERMNGLVEGAIHDTVAFAFLFVVVLTFCFSSPSAGAERRILRYFVAMTVLLNGALLVLSLVLPRIGGVIELSNGIRFLGLSANPNQLGQLLSTMPFLCVYFLFTEPSIKSRLLYLTLFGVSIVIGFASKSDAVIVSWIAATLLLVCTSMLTTLQQPLAKSSEMFNNILITLNLLLAALSLFLAAMWLPNVSALMDDVFLEIESGDEGGIRLLLWTEALNSLVMSPIVGLGAGPQVVSPYFKVAREAHNSYLDFALMVGVLGLGSFLVLISVIVFRSKVLGQPLLLGALVALLGFGFFHYIFRHPIFWFNLMLIAAMASQRAVAVRATPRVSRAAVPLSHSVSPQLVRPGLKGRRL